MSGKQTHQEPVVSFGRDITGNLPASETREWLVTNGIGGFASGTVSGILRRRYHGLLIAALNPPHERTLLASKLEEEVSYEGSDYPLSSNRWGSQEISPRGFIHIESFFLDGLIPTWIFAVGDALIEKKIWMEPGRNTTYVRYQIKRASSQVLMKIKSLVNYRGYHTLTHADNWKMQIDPTTQGFQVLAFKGARPFHIRCPKGVCSIENVWYGNFLLSLESQRGLDAHEDHLLAGKFELSLREGEAATVVLSAESDVDLDGESALERRRSYERAICPDCLEDPPWIRHLKKAADQFIVERKGADSGKSIIAGYPWFSDWGRDALFSVPGLLLKTKRFEDARGVLRTFAAHVDRGMIPNFFNEEGSKQYNSVDASLWFIHTLHAAYDETKDISFLQEFFPTVQEIIASYLRGTLYSIGVDGQDGLLFSGEEGVQLTWMDAKVGSQVITPRTGKAIEVNALWYNALKSASLFAKLMGVASISYDAAADKARSGFSKFWSEEKGYCYDVIDGPQGSDISIRPNQVFAVSLRESPLPPARQRLVVEALCKKLLTTFGLRSLAQDDPRYRGHYGGDPLERDTAYHQGTAWGFLTGPLTLAHYRVYQNEDKAKSLLLPFLHHLSDAGLGSVSEIFDGDAPMPSRGAPFQAWSVASLIEAWDTLKEKGSNKS
ncbi:amylo-alpha-1,6-glucosidase [Estrella lausannensis]|uniref:Putative glycogen debranching enzyme n=1 Tax=Estrella lausannensis TaxID=483423 RepID=A0A0H5E384_9BACT|nr:amylo-alpha-1,6-glucosidase [Estrella lausannensis]CRX37670.1 putative glycogen debranching enzyme [Estrella lausannensis]